MKRKFGKGYSPKSSILGNWVWEGSLEACPNCALPVIRIIETGAGKLYYHAEKIICSVKK